MRGEVHITSWRFKFMLNAMFVWFTVFQQRALCVAKPLTVKRLDAAKLDS